MGRVVYNRYTAPIRRRGSKKDSKEISVFILAASPGHRMKSYGPKILLTLDNKTTILENILNNTKNYFPNSEILISLGFEADKVIKLVPQEIHVIENQLFETTNTIEDCRLCLNAATNTSVIIIHGDLIFNNNILEDLTKNGSTVIIDNNHQMSDEEIGVTVVDNKITILSYGLPQKWCYIVYLEGNELEMFKRFCNNRENNRQFVWEGLNYVLEGGGQIHTTSPKDMQINKIETSKDI